MKSFIFKIAIILSKVLRYISYLGAGFTLLGSVLTLIFKDDVIQEVESYQFNLQEVSLPFIIYSCLSALMIFIVAGFSLDKFEKILVNLEKKDYFSDLNSKYSKNILIAILILTTCQIISKLVFNYLKVDNISSVFNLTIKDYLTNIIFMVIAFSSMIIFDTGKSLKEDSVIINLDQVLKKKNMTSKELAGRIGITEANLSILKTGKAKGIRFNTLASICKELDCQPGDLLEYVYNEE